MNSYLNPVQKNHVSYYKLLMLVRYKQQEENSILQNIMKYQELKWKKLTNDFLVLFCLFNFPY